jgi:hypothetical protein
MNHYAAFVALIVAISDCLPLVDRLADLPSLILRQLISIEPETPTLVDAEETIQCCCVANRLQRSCRLLVSGDFPGIIEQRDALSGFGGLPTDWSTATCVRSTV